MKVFVTGATGFVGAAVTAELIAHGHRVLGLARSDQAEAALRGMGAGALRGDLAATAVLRQGAEAADAVIHTGFNHDFTRFAEACALDHAAIMALGEAICGAAKPLIVTAGLAGLHAAGPLAVEAERAHPPSDAYPRASEAAAQALCDAGIPVTVMRLPPSVHGQGDHGFVPLLIDIARRSGTSACVGEGGNRWPAVHVRDAARAYRLALGRGPAARTCHVVGEEGIAFRCLAEAIAGGLSVPLVPMPEDEARRHFGWFFGFAAMDQPAAATATRAWLGWEPDGPDLLSDLYAAGYFPGAAG